MKRRQSSWVRRRLPMLVAIAAIVLLVLIIVLIARGCSKKPSEGIEAKAFSTGTVITLPVNAELNNGDFVSYGGYQFETGKKLGSMAKLVTKNNDGVTGTSYSNSYGVCWVFTRKNDAGTDSWCLYQRDPGQTKNWYIFMGEHREVSLPTGAFDTLLPLHLITDAALRDSMFGRIELGTPYSCGCDKMPEGQTIAGMFRAFYEESNLYNVSTSEMGFTLVPKGSAQQLIFQFNDDGSKFMVTVPEDTEPEPTANATVRSGSGDPVTLIENDALSLSSILLQSNFKRTGKPADYTYTADLDGKSYELSLEWKDNTWAASVHCDDGFAVLTTRNACTVAAILANNLVGDMPARSDEVTASFAAMPTCMATTTGLNVRSQPSTNSTRLATLQENTAVAVIAKSDDGWYEVLYNDKRAYMSADYLKAVYSADSEPGSND